MAPAADSPYASRPWLASYPEGVPADFAFPKVPVTRLLDDAAASFPTTAALAFLGTTLTYRQLKEQVDSFAGALAGLGVRKGDRVAIVLPNCPQNVIALFAALRLGAVVVQHNPLYTETELRHQLADCGAKVVVCLDRVYETVARGPPADGGRDGRRHEPHRLPADGGEAQAAAAAGVRAQGPRAGLGGPAEGRARTPVPRAAEGVVAAQRQTPLEPETDLALLQYTGGTTGASRGAMLTHHNLVADTYMNRLWDTGATAGKEVTLGVLPLFHAYGLTVAMLNTVLLGGTLVLLPRFDLDQVFAAIDAHKPTLLPGVPPIYKAMADSPKAKQHDLSSIRLCVSGAMKLPLEVQTQFERLTGARLIEGYGMTETSPSTHANPVGASRPGSIGLPLPGTLCTVVDDAGQEVPVGSPGELAIRGPQVFTGYWNRPDQSGVFTDDGYVLTGDVAVMDDDGYFTIVDRKKELIIAGGFNIYPSEVEEVLFRLPGVADAVVIGVPDRYRGETVKAFVVLHPGADVSAEDVVAHCAVELTAYKVPKLVEFRTELPRTPVGKVLRRVLVEEERARAAASAEPVPGSVPGGVRRAAPAAPVGAAAAEDPRPQDATGGDVLTAGDSVDAPAPRKARPRKAAPSGSRAATDPAKAAGPAAQGRGGRAGAGPAQGGCCGGHGHATAEGCGDG